jgi:hypothetical protein
MLDEIELHFENNELQFCERTLEKRGFTGNAYSARTKSEHLRSRKYFISPNAYGLIIEAAGSNA